MIAHEEEHLNDSRIFDIGDWVKWDRIIGPGNAYIPREYRSRGVISDIMGSHIVVMEDHMMVNFRLQHVLDTNFAEEMKLQKLRQKVGLATPEFIKKYSDYETYQQRGKSPQVGNCMFVNNTAKNAIHPSAIFLRFLGSGLRYDYLISCNPDTQGNFNIFPFSKNERPIHVVFQNVIMTDAMSSASWSPRT